MEDLLIRRKNIVERLMKNVVYRLTDYTCDGTANTAINTGIYLFDSTAFPNGWTIEIDFYVTQRVSLGAIIRCRCAATPYDGISIRSNSTANQIQLQVNGSSAIVVASDGVRVTATIDYTPSTGVCTINGVNTSTLLTYDTADNMTGKTVPLPLCVGGENNNDASNFTWKSGRFSKCHINSLIVRTK